MANLIMYKDIDVLNSKGKVNLYSIIKQISMNKSYWGTEENVNTFYLHYPRKNGENVKTFNIINGTDGITIKKGEYTLITEEYETAKLQSQTLDLPLNKSDIDDELQQIFDKDNPKSKLLDYMFIKSSSDGLSSLNTNEYYNFFQNIYSFNHSLDILGQNTTRLNIESYSSITKEINELQQDYNKIIRTKLNEYNITFLSLPIKIDLSTADQHGNHTFPAKIDNLQISKNDLYSLSFENNSINIKDGATTIRTISNFCDLIVNLSFRHDAPSEKISNSIIYNMLVNKNMFVSFKTILMKKVPINNAVGNYNSFREFNYVDNQWTTSTNEIKNRIQKYNVKEILSAINTIEQGVLPSDNRFTKNILNNIITELTFFGISIVLQRKSVNGAVNKYGGTAQNYIVEVNSTNQEISVNNNVLKTRFHLEQILFDSSNPNNINALVTALLDFDNWEAFQKIISTKLDYTLTTYTSALNDKKLDIHFNQLSVANYRYVLEQMRVNERYWYDKITPTPLVGARATYDYKIHFGTDVMTNIEWFSVTAFNGDGVFQRNFNGYQFKRRTKEAIYTLDYAYPEEPSNATNKMSDISFYSFKETFALTSNAKNDDIGLKTVLMDNSGAIMIILMCEAARDKLAEEIMIETMNNGTINIMTSLMHGCFGNNFQAAKTAINNQGNNGVHILNGITLWHNPLNIRARYDYYQGVYNEENNNTPPYPISKTNITTLCKNNYIDM